MGWDRFAHLKMGHLYFFRNLKSKNDFYAEYNINYLNGNHFFKKKMTLTLINLTDLCTEVLHLYFNQVNLMNLVKQHINA